MFSRFVLTLVLGVVSSIIASSCSMLTRPLQHECQPPWVHRTYEKGEEALLPGSNYNATLAVALFRSAATLGCAPAQYRTGLMLQSGAAGVPRNLSEALRYLSLAATFNTGAPRTGTGTAGSITDNPQQWLAASTTESYASAQSDLGAMYILGHGVPRDLTMAVAWLSKAAAGHGLKDAQYNLGILLLKEGSGRAHWQEGKQWMEKAAWQGHPEAQDTLGVMSINGDKTAAKDYRAGLSWLMLAARQNNSARTEELVAFERGLKEEGKGAVWEAAVQQADAFVPVSPCTSAHFTRASHCNSHGTPTLLADRVQQVCVCVCDNEELYSGPRCEPTLYREAEALVASQNHTGALAAFRAAAAQHGFAPAQYRVGKALHQSPANGVAAGICRDTQHCYTEAAQYFRLAAQQHYAVGENALGAVYNLGLGLAQSEAKAVVWAGRAAAQGLRGGQDTLGLLQTHLLYSGNLLVNSSYAEERDRGYFAQGMAVLKAAAAQGFAKAQDALGILYFNGDGKVAKDVKLALFWLVLASNQRYEGSLQRMTVAANKCTGVCREAAMQLVATFVPVSPCTSAHFTRASHCNSHGTPTLLADRVQQVCVCVCDNEELYSGPRCEPTLYREAEALVASQNHTGALAAFRAAAAQHGFAPAQYRMGLLLEAIHGPTNSEAVQQIVYAAEKGYALAQLTLASKFLYGQRFTKNIRRGIEWQSKAANQGLSEGQHNLAVSYFDSFDEKVQSEGIVLLKRAARQGESAAQNRLGAYFYNGNKTVLQSFERAVYFVKLAALQGDEHAVKNLPVMEQVCTGTCADNAQNLVKSFFVESPCSVSRFTGRSYCSGHGTPTAQEDRHQTVCVCACDDNYSGPRCEPTSYFLGRKLYGAGKFAEALAALLPQALGGFAPAQYRVGTMFKAGEGARQDPAQAIRHMVWAAEQGYAVAQNDVGMMYWQGFGSFEKNLPQGMAWIEKAARQGVRVAQTNLAMHYLLPQAASKYYADGLLWLKRAALAGHDDAQNYLGVYYFKGEKTAPVDVKLALFWLTVAAQSGSKQASTNLLKGFVQKQCFGECRANALQLAAVFVPASPCAAPYSTRRIQCHNHGTPAVQRDDLQTTCLCTCDDGWEGVRCEPDAYVRATRLHDDKNYIMAHQAYLAAARVGYAPAQHAVASMLQAGAGVARDDATAVYYYTQAAEQGYAAAQSDLGAMISQGRGVVRDAEGQYLGRAVEWLKKAAEQGLGAGQENLGGVLIARNYTAKDDFKEGLVWTQKAARFVNGLCRFRNIYMWCCVRKH